MNPLLNNWKQKRIEVRFKQKSKYETEHNILLQSIHRLPYGNDWHTRRIRVGFNNLIMNFCHRQYSIVQDVPLSLSVLRPKLVVGGHGMTFREQKKTTGISKAVPICRIKTRTVSYWLYDPTHQRTRVMCRIVRHVGILMFYL